MGSLADGRIYVAAGSAASASFHACTSVCASAIGAGRDLRYRRASENRYSISLPIWRARAS
jgi:hypothetical protein